MNIKQQKTEISSPCVQLKTEGMQIQLQLTTCSIQKGAPEVSSFERRQILLSHATCLLRTDGAEQNISLEKYRDFQEDMILVQCQCKTTFFKGKQFYNCYKKRNLCYQTARHLCFIFVSDLFIRTSIVAPTQRHSWCLFSVVFSAFAHLRWD